MKSIADTLNVIRNAVAKFERQTKKETLAALIGGHAVIFYGVERTTLDVDTCFYSAEDEAGKIFHIFLKRHLPNRFKTRFIEASRDPSDPLKHDLIIIRDVREEYPRIDILVARYKWELEGLREARFIKELSYLVMPLPHLLMMKLRAGSRRDELDVLEMLKGMSGSEIKRARGLAKRVGRDKKFKMLLKEAERKV